MSENRETCGCFGTGYESTNDVACLFPAMKAERDAAVFALEMQAKALGPNPTLPSFIKQATDWLRERDALAETVARLEKLVKKRFTRTGTKDGMPAHECIECGDWNYAKSKIEHAPDCLVREIQERREKAKVGVIIPNCEELKGSKS